MRSLKVGWRRYVEAKGETPLGFVEDYDDYGVLLVDRRDAYRKE